LAWAARDERILLTFDKDFGKLAKAFALPTGCGIVLFRLPMPKPSAVGSFLAAILAARDDWADHSSVVEAGRVRMRPLRQ
jgi:predicted nuclease of predicted toxin-antitoxin system